MHGYECPLCRCFVGRDTQSTHGKSAVFGTANAGRMVTRFWFIIVKRSLGRRKRAHRSSVPALFVGIRGKWCSDYGVRYISTHAHHVAICESHIGGATGGGVFIVEVLGFGRS
ncbi:unnamed protein product [Ectocarpus sp. 12 AP-2014]